MTTPTNHTTSSLFDFGDMLDPEPSQSSLEQNSSIEDSNIFETESHVCEQTQKKPKVHDKLEALTSVEEKSNAGDNGILKPPSYSVPRCQEGLEETTNLKVETNPEPTRGDSLPLNTKHSAKPPFSPTVHTSNQTHGFSKPQAFSPTFRTSNQTHGLKSNVPSDATFSMGKNRMENLEMTKPCVDQNAERAIAWAIYIALVFFCALIIAFVVLALGVSHTYGFVTLVLVTLVVIFCAFLACFVDNTILQQNSKFKPVRQKILTVVRTAHKILEDEYHLFMRDWKENFLITQNGEGYSKDAVENLMDDDANIGEGATRAETAPKTRRKTSKVFKFIRPFLGLKKKSLARSLRKKSKNANKSYINGSGSPSNIATTYEAPII